MNIKNVKYITELKKLGYPLNEMLVIGSGTMTLYGLKENTDLDLWVTHRLYKRMSYDKRLHKDARGMLKTKNDEIECHFLLPCSHGSIEENLKRAVMVDGVYFMSLKDVIAWKKCIGRPKDHERIKMIEDYMRKHLVENYLQYTQEGTFLSDKTISIDLDKFISGKSNKLIIAGLSGSGKTTLGYKLAEKYNAVCIETDNCFSREELPIHLKDKDFAEQIQTPGDTPIKQIFRRMYEECIKEKLLSNKRYVLEGGFTWETGIFYPYIQKEINRYPIIIIGASAFLSSLRILFRSPEKKKYLHIEKIYKAYYRNFQLLEPLLKKFKEARLKAGGDVQEFIIP